jgi:DNA repair protein RecO (recombination protein O)
MALVSDACICLRKFEYSETSQILTLFAREHGLLRVVAKGAHRTTKEGASKFGGGIDLLDRGDAVFIHDPAREMGTLTEWKLRDGHLELRRNLRAIYLAQYAAELTAMLIEEHDPHPELYDRLKSTLTELGTPRAEESFVAFELDLLHQTGHLADLEQCVSCGRSLEGAGWMYFSPSRGGAICRSCEPQTPDRMQIDPRLMRIVQGILKLPRVNGSTLRLPRLTRHQTDPINRMVAAQVHHMLGRRLRMVSYVLPR